MKPLPLVRALFIIAAIYDGALGLAFLVAAPALFDRCRITPPNHFGYVHFAASLLIVFALMFAAVAANPTANRNLIPYGILLKLCYSGTVLFHWMNSGVPMLWKPFFFADLIFACLFVWAYALSRGPKPTRC